MQKLICVLHSICCVFLLSVSVCSFFPWFFVIFFVFSSKFGLSNNKWIFCSESVLHHWLVICNDSKEKNKQIRLAITNSSEINNKKNYDLELCARQRHTLIICLKLQKYRENNTFLFSNEKLQQKRKDK